MRVTISRRLAIPVKQPSNPRQHPCKLKTINKNFWTNVEEKTSAQEMRPSLRASWRAHPPRSPPGGGKNHYWTKMWNVLTCICHYGDDSTPEKEQIHIVPEENDVPPFLILVAKLFPFLLAVFFPTIGVPDGDHGYAHPYLFTYSLIMISNLHVCFK